MLNQTRAECAGQVTKIAEDVQLCKNDIRVLKQQNLQQEQQSMKETIQGHAQKIEDLEKCKCEMIEDRGGKEFEDVTGRPGHRVQDSDTVEYVDDDD